MAFKTGAGAKGKKRRTCTKWHWTHEEDDLLTTLVMRHGPGNWDYIARHIRGRTGKSCRLRWINQLNPKVDKSPFSEEEHRRLLDLHRENGNKWSIIASFFPGRTDNQVKNQYHVLVGTRYMKASGPSDAHGPLKRGSIGLSQYGSVSTVAVGSQFSNVSCRGINYCGFAPCVTAMPDSIEMMPLFSGGPSSVYGRDGTWLAARPSNLSMLGPHSFDSINLGDIYAHQSSTSHVDSMMSDANSAAISEFCPVAQPQQGVDAKDYQFIDFLGVASSE